MRTSPAPLQPPNHSAPPRAPRPQPPAGRRHLTQADPFTVFNEPAAPATVASGAPSVNINGVGAAAGSATTVPVMGTLAAPLQPVPGATYAAGYAPVAVGGVSVRGALGSGSLRGALSLQGEGWGDREGSCRARCFASLADKPRL